MSSAADQLLDKLEVALAEMPARRYWIAYSGGVDSHVLLHAVALLRTQLQATLHAVHVNHGLNPAANEWAAHAVTVCDALGIPCHIFTVDGAAAKGESPEAAARDARYHAFSQLIEAGDCLLTAHHQEDQSETLMLQLLRGAGPHGLAAMPARSGFYSGEHGRPLLTVSQAEIKAYATERSLCWIEDPSNQDQGFERNFLRHKVFPTLAQHWPALSRTLSRAAGHCAEAAGLLDELALDDLRKLSGWCSEEPVPATLPLSALRRMPPPRRQNLLRLWIKKVGLPIVSTKIMRQIEVSFIEARVDAQPLIKWPGGELRRYRDRLYAMMPLEPFDATREIPWQWQKEPLLLPQAGVRLMAKISDAETQPGQVAGLSLAQCQQLPMTIRFRRGGERCRLKGREHRHELKGLLQTAGVPPWQRERIPLIYLGDQLAVVVGHFCCAPFEAKTGEESVIFSIH